MRKAWQLLGLSLLFTSCGLQAAPPATPETGPELQVTDAEQPAFTTSSEPDVIPGELIIKLSADQTLEGLAAQSGLSLHAVRALSGGEILARVDSLTAQSGTGAVALAQQLSASPGVEYAQPNYRVHGFKTPNDTYYRYQWHYGKMSLPTAWDITTGKYSPVVAVIDTGKTAHPDLKYRWVGGYDFISSSTTAADGNGRDSDATDVGDGMNGQPSSFHGTHVAGTAGASTNNSSGVAGANWSARILPVRVLGKGGGSTADIIDSIRWSAGMSVSGVPSNAYPAKVLNLSLGGYLGSGKTCSTYDPATQSAINDVTARGATVVVAAGNSNDNAAYYTPASCNNTVTVAATEMRNYRAPYSNYGSYIDVAAPGGDTSVDRNGDGYRDGVLSTLKRDEGTYTYSFYQGTSMAAPHVAGLVSLMYAVKPGITPSQVLSTLKNTASPLSSTACSGGCGAGLVNAYKAVDAARKLP